MPHISLKSTKSLKAGLQAKADDFDVSLSALIRHVLRDWLDSNPEGLPEHIQRDISHQIVVEENRWQMRCLYFESNVRNHLTEALEKPIPPPPERMEELYVESLRRQVVEEFPERFRQDFEEFIDMELERYAMLHPEAGAGQVDQGELVESLAKLARFGSWNRAQELANSVVERGMISRDAADAALKSAREEVHGEWSDEMWADIRSD